jgi:hypothetical protein
MVKLTGSPQDRDTLQHYAQVLSDEIYEILKEVPVTSLVTQTYLDLLRRIRATLFGVVAQLPLWPSVPEMKLPIELLLRTTLTDSLTLLYLSTFDKSEQSFTNELLLLDNSVVKYMEAYIDNDDLMGDPTTAQDKQVKKDTIYEMIPAWRSATGNKAKSFKEARATSDISLFLASGVPEAGHQSPLTEKAMFEQVKAFPETYDLAHLYIFQRLFSQSHHYARFNRLYLDWEFDHACLNWFIAMRATYHTVAYGVKKLGASPAMHSRILNNVYDLTAYMADADNEPAS